MSNHVDPPAEEPGDDDLLARIDTLHWRRDPPPADFDERVIFGLAVAGLDAELARLVDDELVGARGEQTAARTITFDAQDTTLLVRVQPEVVGTIRLDGWLAPPAAAVVEVRVLHGGDRREQADEDGRFEIAHLPAGLLQLVVRAPDGASVLLLTPVFDV